MSIPANSTALAQQARRTYVEALSNGMAGVVQSVVQAARQLPTQVADPVLAGRRRDVITALARSDKPWLDGMTTLLRGALHRDARTASRSGSGSTRNAKLSLVDDDTIDNEIVRSRLAMAIMDRASWEFTDLRSRMMSLEQREELDTHDVLRPHVLAQMVTGAWREAGLTLDGWRALQDVLQDEFSHFAEEAYHETNRSLIQAKVLPEIDLRPFIRRSRNTVGYSGGGGGGGGGASSGATGAGGAQRSGPGSMDTRAPLRGVPYRAGGDQSDSVLGRLAEVVDRQVRGFADISRGPRAASPGLGRAIEQAQQGIARRSTSGGVGTPAMLEEIDQRKQLLKQAAATPVERATIEIVALMFQSLLTEERIPATMRIWFARLQMPVLRVAVTEPDFFAAADHPARRLIDRMGACVMGFDATARPAGEALDREIKRVVQVVEAYPDTGRRVFQTVLTEFERFLENYYRNENEASRKGVSLAHQVEQRETLAIQYTIELRKMLNEVPVQEGVREFLFHVWADVLAMAAVKSGNQSDATKEMKRAAADLIWSASAKVSREERAEVIRRLPPLLKTLRDGMDHAGVPADKQDEHIQRLNNSLAAAFTAKAAAIPHERLEELMARLETLEELLPEAADLEIDESMIHDLSGHESSELEVVGEGGSMPTPAMISWARELQVGTWYMLDYRNRNEAVQLAWHGMRRQLTLFVSPQGRGVLFQQNRLAAFLQAGLLVPAQEESLTVRATRSAMAKIDGDPSRLLN